MKNLIKTRKAFLFDLDGVLFVGDSVIEGAIEVITKIKSLQLPCRFLTNTTTRSFDSLHKKLVNLNLPINKEELFAPPKVAAHYLRKKENLSLYLILEEETKTEFLSFTIDEDNPDYIVLGHYSNRWNYELMQKLFDKVMNGAKMLALHKGRYWLTEGGLTLDIGAFIAGLEHATGQKAEVVGKPEKTFFNIALEDTGVDPTDAVMIGDDIINDIKGAKDAGIPAVLVKTGKYREDAVARAEIQPDIIINSIASLSDFL